MKDRDRHEGDIALGVAYEDYLPYDPAWAEKGLLIAVLVNALADFKKEGASGKTARTFFLSDEEDYIFSFRSICSFLEVDPQRVLVVIGLDSVRNSE